MDSHFWAGVLRPIFWLLVMVPLLATLRWLLVRYIKPRMTPEQRDFWFRKITD